MKVKQCKDNTEFITPSAICEDGRTAKHIVRHISVLMGDIGRLAPRSTEQLVEKPGKRSHALPTHIIHSGIGVYFFYPVYTVDKSIIRKPSPDERCSFVIVSAMPQRINILIKIPLSAIKIGSSCEKWNLTVVKTMVTVVVGVQN